MFFYTARAGKRPLTGRVELAPGSAASSRTRALHGAGRRRTGLVQHANELPLDEVGAGPYELRVTLSDGRTTVHAIGGVRAAALTAGGRVGGYWCACGAARSGQRRSPAASARPAPGAPCFSR